MTRSEDVRADRLTELAQAYGADPSRWPEPDRHLFHEASDRLPAILAEAEEIDKLLSRASSPPSGTVGRDRLLTALGREEKPGNVVALPVRRAHTRNLGRMIAAAALAASLALGVYLGTLDDASAVFSPSLSADDDPVDLAGLGDVSDYLEDQS